MQNCNCTRIYKLGCFLCGQPGVMMPFNAPVTGTFRVVFLKDEGVRFIDFQATEGEPMIVPLSGLNENYTHRFYILDPEESVVLYEHTDNVDYDCFQVRIVPAQEGEVTMIRLSGITCENLTDEVYGLTEEQLQDCLGCGVLECVLCDVVTPAAPQDVVDCVTPGNVPALLAATIIREEATPEVVVVALDGADKTDGVKELICPAFTPVEIFQEDVGGNPQLWGTIGSGGQYTDARVAIVTAYDATLEFIAGGEVQYTLRSMEIFYVNHLGATASHINTIASLNANFIPDYNPPTAELGGFTNPLPQFKVFLSNGVTVYATGGINVPTVTLPLQPVKNSLGNTVSSHEVGADGAAPDATVQRKDSAAADIGAPIAIPSGTNQNVTCPDGTANALNSAASNVGSASVKSNGTANINIADSVLTHPDGTTSNLPATVAFNIQSLRSGVAYAFGSRFWSGQATSYRTGDEGNLFANGWFDYTAPVYPTNYAMLGADFLTLAANNIHGNTLRFTDRTGAAPATTGNRVIQDHLTGIEWYRPNVMPGSQTWNTAIDASNASSVEGNTDWWLPPICVLESIHNRELSDGFNYGGFLTSTNLWSSTTNAFNTAIAIRMLGTGALGAPQAGVAKTTTNNYLFCRKFL